MARRTEENYKEAIKIWKKENPDKKYLDIPTKKVIDVEGVGPVNIGLKIVIIRQIYKAMQEGKHYCEHKDLTEEEISYWTNEGMIWDYKKWTEENYREAAKIWKKQNPDKKELNIPRKTIIDVDGIGLINIGSRINIMRQIYKAMQRKEHFGVSRDLTEEEIEYWTREGMIWGYKKNKQEKNLETCKVFKQEKLYKTDKQDKYKEAVRIWKEQNPDKKYLDISTNTVIDVDEVGPVNIGNRISIMRQIYKAMQEGKHFYDMKDLTEEEIEYWTNEGMIWDYEQYRKENSNLKTKSILEKYIKIFNGDKEKAENIVKCLKELKGKRKEDKFYIEDILNEFNMDIKTLINHLNRIRTLKYVKRDDVLEYKGLTLEEFCINNGYNYDIINYAIRLHKFCQNDTLEQLINRSIIINRNKKEPATWIYERYGTLVRHILLHLNFEASKILKHMTNDVISLEEAIRHSVFIKTRKDRKQDYLEEFYNYLVGEVDLNKREEEIIENVITKYQELTVKYHFTKEEHEVIIESFQKYVKTIKEYQIVEVGLEPDEAKRLEKIKDYGLEPEDVEKSYFIPVEFDTRVLLGRRHELYKRRLFIKGYVVWWDYYTDEEKEKIKLKNNFTEEEIRMIESNEKDANKPIENIKKLN